MVEKRKEKEKTEVQRVFVHCRNRPEDVMAFCRVAPHIRRIPHEIEVPENPKWHLALNLTLHNLPAPYQEHQKDLFWQDIDKLLSASLASREEHASRGEKGGNRKETEMWRWPSLLVTDSKKTYPSPWRRHAQTNPCRGCKTQTLGDVAGDSLGRLQAVVWWARC